MSNVIEFPRGDAITHTFSIPQTAWSSGGKLIFEAKPAIDDDNTDAAAVISQEWTDASTSVVTINGIQYIQYACAFPPSATNSIPSNGADSATYKGEFQWVNAAGVPTTYPPNDPKLPVVVYFDVVRKTT
jgi:hypothetical protein